MKNKLALLIGVVIAFVLAFQMFTFQVRYDEVAVRAFFEKASPEGLIDGGKQTGVIFGLYPKLPWPFHRVYTYSQKLQILDGEQTDVRTADGKVIIVKLYCTWRIDDALQFYTSQRTIYTAENNMRQQLRNLTNIVSRYEFRQFVNTDEAQLKLDDFEQACTEKLRRDIAAQGYGIHIEHVGIRQVLLSESITPKVFEAMKKHQEYLAAKASAEGDAAASAIRESANSIRDQILAFADSHAKDIRAEGIEEAAQYYGQFQQDPQFAIYLRNLDALRQTLGNNTTFVLDANQNSFLKPLVTEGAK